MKHIKILLFISLLTTIGAVAGVIAAERMPFAANVDPETGAISVPEDYTLWPTLGTWTHAKVDGGATNIHEYHVVYTQPETIEYYKRSAGFPTGPYWSKSSCMRKPCP